VYLHGWNHRWIVKASNQKQAFWGWYAWAESKMGKQRATNTPLFRGETEKKSCLSSTNLLFTPSVSIWKIPLRWSNCSSCIMHSCLRGRGSKPLSLLHGEEDTLHKKFSRTLLALYYLILVHACVNSRKSPGLRSMSVS